MVGGFLRYYRFAPFQPHRDSCSSEVRPLGPNAVQPYVARIRMGRFKIHPPAGRKFLL